jgi:hypothetical protein
MRPKLNEDTPWGGEFFPKGTRQTYQLLGTPSCARESCHAPPLPRNLQQISDHQKLVLVRGQEDIRSEQALDYEYGVFPYQPWST